ncbi:MAG: FkbM family methyltransferase [Chthoniobacterales bacterium]
MYVRVKHWVAGRIKSALYGTRGEPYQIRGHTLRYLPGSRPVRLCYTDSPDINVRNDARQVEYLSREVKSGDVAIDVGAHFGQYSLIFAALCGDEGQVIAFEPDPHAREGLLKNFSLNAALKTPIVETTALLDCEGEATLYSHGGNAESSLSLEGIAVRDSRSAEEIAVTTTTLDNYVKRANLDRISWVKIDAEGAEIRILQGASSILKTSARFLCELHPYAWAAFGTTLAELQDVVRTAGRTMTYLESGKPVSHPASYGIVLIA